MSNSNDNLAIWNEVERTDPEYTKQFSRGGGFKGTATNATYLIKKATKMFGPIGIGWGWNIIDETYQPGQDKDVVHVLRIKLWYEWNGKRGEIEHFGQTQFVGKNRNGYFTDEEAPKKSLTDALSKSLSTLGFAADIHLGMYDDNGYVRDLKADFRDEDEFANDNKRGGDRRDDRPAQKDEGSAPALTADEADAIIDKWEKAIKECPTNKDVLTLVGSEDFKTDLAKLHVDDEKFLRKKANDRSKELKANRDNKSDAA